MQRFKNILCVVAANAENGLALERAVALAENNQARLTVADVFERLPAGIRLPDGGSISNDVRAAILAEHQRRLETLTTPWRERIGIQVKVLTGKRFLEIIREVLRGDHDLVIKLAEPGDLADRVFGSDDMHLLRKCPCPVWLVRPRAPSQYRCVLAALDVDDRALPPELKVNHGLNRQILEMAASLALAESAELHVVHVWDAIGESVMRSALMSTPEEKIRAYVETERTRHTRALHKALDELKSEAGNDALVYLKPVTHLPQGGASREIPALVKRIRADVLLMGTVGRTSIPGFFIGNTAETILNRIDCSVLAVKPEGFVTPVTLALPFTHK